ncbi:MAG: gliding motility-associated C-terminal domain-containing protein [Bacteroidetes bacterium]|nr:gliding motility-associated C-terminal domain-containing protein [Bacteroidota bacterium]
MKKLIKLALAFGLLLPTAVYSQCTLNLFSSPDTVVCGECATLSAFGSMDGNVAFQEDFNSGSPVGWQFTQTTTIANNTCGVPSPDGTDFMWMGDASVNPRDMTTVGFDLSLGGTICFEMRYSIQADASPCEGPDEPDEGVYLQYSTNGGTNWQTIQYWDPNGGNDPNLINWNQYCVTIPSGAMTANTMIQWHQDAVSGAEYDHWGIDNVIITLNDPNSTITWLHDGYSYPIGSGGGINPTPVCLRNDSTFTAQITNGVNTCTQSITIGVKNPVVTVSAEPDTSICPGECVQIIGESKVVISPAGIKTFENNQTETVGGFGVGNIGASVNVNVQNLNMNAVLAGSITEVCINGFNYFSFGFPSSTTVADFEYNLVAPGGCASINLIPQGSLLPSSQFGPGLQNVCFQVGAATNLSSQNEPYSGIYNPNQTFDNAMGCDPNGVWSIEVSAPSGFSLGTGAFTGWSITFDDPEISYPADFTWFPTSNMTDSNSLNPTVCPTGNTTYTITASDSNNCIIVTDDVIITMNPSCCDFDISATVTNPSCANNDGGIDLTVSNGSGNYSYDWGGGVMTQDLTGIGSGSYTVTVTDLTQGCSKDTIIVVLPSGAAPFIDSINVVHTSCGNNNGEILINVSGGTGSLVYSIDNDVTTQSGNQFTGLTSGVYDVVVTDGLGCKANQQVTINPSNTIIIDSVVTTNPSCGANSGTITVFASGGNGTISYSIDNGVNFQVSSTFASLGSGNYTVVVQDASGCSASQIVNLSAAGAPTITSIAPTNPTCNNNNGQLVINATGTGTLTYSIDNGVTSQSSGTFTGLDNGTYTIVVTDGLGCESPQIVNLTDVGNPVINTVNTTNPSCGNNNGGIAVNATGGTGALTYSIDNGTTTQSGNSFTGLSNGTFDVVVTDAVGCIATQQVVLNMLAAPVITSITSNDENCTSANGDVTILATGTGTLTYSIDNGVTTQTGNVFSGLSSGTYNVIVTDANSCSVTQQVVVGRINTVDAIFSANPNTGIAPLEVNFTNQSVGTTSYSWTFGDGNTSTLTNPTNTYVSFGDFVVTLIATDGFGCFDTARTTIVVNDEYTILIPNVFTPNGDGKNDVVFIKTTFIDELNVEIFNRWGLKLYEITTPKDSWNGGDATDGTYFFMLKAKSVDGEAIEKNGTVTLLR